MARKPKPTEETREKPVAAKRPGRNGGTLNTGGGGRPKGSVSITRHLREALEAQDEKQAKQLAQAIILQAAKGNGAAMKVVLDRIDGAVVQKQEIDLRTLDDDTILRLLSRSEE